jgi:hypothetical protein
MSARRLAATVFLVAVALYFAMHLLESVASTLIIVAVVGLVVMGVVVAVRARRSRW